MTIPIKQKRMNTNCETNGGFTLLLSVLIASLILTIGLSILNIAFKELTLSSSARESVIAFYAADSGAECALYWDIQQDSFVGNKQISCEGKIFQLAGSGPWTIILDTLGNGSSCSTVRVTKVGETTTIESRGYNTCDTGNPRRVERAVRVIY